MGGGERGKRGVCVQQLSCHGFFRCILGISVTSPSADVLHPTRRVTKHSTSTCMTTQHCLCHVEWLA